MAVTPAAASSTLQLRADRDRPRLSRRRERAEDDDDDEGNDEGARASSGRGCSTGDAAAPPSQGRPQQKSSGRKDEQEQEPARKRRKKRPSTGTAVHERLSLLGGPAAPGPWVVADRQSGGNQFPSRKLARLPKNSSKAAAGLVDAAAMEAEGVDRQFADMLSEYLKIDATMEDASASAADSQPVDSSRNTTPARSTITSSTSWQPRPARERIIPGIGPRSSMQSTMSVPGKLAAFSALGYRDGSGTNGDAASDHSSDWEDEEKETADEDGDDSSVADPDRQGEDEDSNSEGFYRNDYPDGEGQDDDDGVGWGSDEEEEEDDEEGEASDQYGDDDD
ncbi:hypothetical protein A4X09_0g3514 [Tilletia walkeri]|uniref:Transcription factor Iwr1 domain-containing protein n=1 Tax=Tilletia walkeri TaxID=117179 RepID=A0A8X7N980_9BASI|nr:hypothetical protein A4X09_0g3514 [Tilletia walkeri]